MAPITQPPPWIQTITPRVGCCGTRIRTGISYPSAAVTVVSSRRAMRGAGPASSARAAPRARASSGVLSCSGLPPASANCANIAAVA